MKLDQTTQRATSIRLFSFARPHMRTFHLTWFAFFLAFFGWFGIAPMMVIVRDDLGLKDGWWARGGPYYVGAYAAQLREVATAANTERGPASHMPGSGGRADIAVPPTIPVVSDIRVRLPLVSK